MRDNPELRGKPIAVAGSSRRAVVLTASYEARPYGVRSALPLYKARIACPELIVVPPDMQKYRSISHEIFAIFRKDARAVEGLSMDEAFVAVGVATLDEARAFAAAIRREVFEATRLTVSAGVATAKMVAKIASDSCKPDGLLAVAPGEEAAFLAPMPVSRLWGIEYISNINGERIFAIAVSATNRQRRTPFNRSFFLAAHVLGWPPCLRASAPSSDGFRLKCANLYT